MSGIRSRRKAERPNEILEAAFQEFVANGYAATRMEDIAKLAGLSKGTIYSYFESKEKVFEACVESVSAAAMLQFDQDDAVWTDDIAADLYRYLERLYAFFDGAPRAREMLRLLIAEAGRVPHLAAAYYTGFMGRVEDRLRERLALASATGQVSMPVECLTEVVLSPPLAYHVMLMLLADRLHVSAAGLFKAHYELLMHGLFGKRSASDDESPGRIVKSDG